ncbi:MULTISPECIES: peptidylprolyl isomerase [Pseudofrankia]|uniref:peptidylprolyl isomerase n=1 Tax=Pseudofrankia TaxID=2994363 RepID=UPI000234B3F2|nr:MULTISPECIES: peptidylprolyl isomerase [Pseudofrankia]
MGAAVVVLASVITVMVIVVTQVTREVHNAVETAEQSQSPSAGAPAGTVPTGSAPTGSTDNASTSSVGDCVYTRETSASGSQISRGGALPPSAATVSTKPATMTISTNYGVMVFALDPEKAPCTVHALLFLAQQKYFDDTTCHRETHGPDAGIYVLQCGDPTATGTGSPGFTYKNENTTGVTYGRGVIAMANAGAGTNGSQFFINYADPSQAGAQALAGGYTVFGQITQGLDVLDRITQPGVEGGAADGAPASKPQILTITITQQ